MSQAENSLPDLASGLAELRRILRDTPAHSLLAGDSLAPHPLRNVARTLATAARSYDDVRAERLLIELRRMWRDLPETRQLEPRTHEQLWDRLVAACIEEFYRPVSKPR